MGSTQIYLLVWEWWVQWGQGWWQRKQTRRAISTPSHPFNCQTSKISTWANLKYYQWLWYNIISWGSSTFPPAFPTHQSLGTCTSARDMAFTLQTTDNSSTTSTWSHQALNKGFYQCTSHWALPMAQLQGSLPDLTPYLQVKLVASRMGRTGFKVCCQCSAKYFFTNTW